MPSLAQVLARPRKASRQSRPGSLRVPPLSLRLVTWQRMSFSEPLVWSGISGRSKKKQLIAGAALQSRPTLAGTAGLRRRVVLATRTLFGWGVATPDRRAFSRGNRLHSGVCVSIMTAITAVHESPAGGEER